MIIDTIQEWFKEVLIDGIISNLSGTFDTVNTKVAEIAGEVGMTPSGWNGGIFNMIRSLSDTVIVPIAGIILTFVMCYELIQLIVEKNNLHDFDTWLFWKWIFKTFCAVLIVTNTWNIVMAVFDVAQSVVDQSAGVIISDAGIDISGVVGDLETTLADWSIGSLLGLWFQSVFVGLCSHILTIAIFLVIYGRMIEVYLTVSVGPIPFATMVNREWGHTGQNYLKSLLALGFQAFLIMVCVGIYAVLVQNIAVGMILPWRSGSAWATRCCCATRCSKPAALQKACSERIKGGINFGICNGPEGPDKNQKQDAVWPDEAAACVFRIGGACGSAAFLFEQGQYGYDLGGAVHDPCYAPVLPVRPL